MDNRSLIPAPPVIPLLLIGLPHSGIESFILYMQQESKLQRQKKQEEFPDRPLHEDRIGM
jgi:hypothetical protein